MRDRRPEPLAAGLHEVASPQRLLNRSALGRAWIGLPPGRGRAAYPLVLDIFDADPAFIADQRARRRYILAGELLAPRFEELRAHPIPLAIDFDETAEQESLFAQQQALALAAEAVVALGRGHGLVVSRPDRLDLASRGFLSLVIDRAPAHGFAVVIGPGDPALSARARRLDLVLGRSAPIVRRATHGDGGALSGWGYLRRHPRLLRDRSPLVVDLHHAFAAGFETIGRDFLFPHYVHLSSRRDVRRDSPRAATLAALAAARLAPRVAAGGRGPTAIALFTRALSGPGVTPVERVDMLQQFANLRAVLGGEPGRDDALAMYDQAERLLAGVGRDRRRSQLVVRILNGRALIAYRRGDHDGAEALEAAALAEADRAGSAWPDLRAWARTLVFGNLATLALRGFGSLDRSIAYSGAARDARNAAAKDDTLETVRLATLTARAGRHDACERLLAPVVGRARRDWSEAGVQATLLYASILASAARIDEARAALTDAKLMIELLGSPVAIAARDDLARALATVSPAASARLERMP